MKETEQYCAFCKRVTLWLQGEQRPGHVVTACTQCRRGPDGAFVMTEPREPASTALATQDPGAFSVDLSQPPYTAVCPVCRAYALEACRDQARDMQPRWLRKRLGLPEDPWPPGCRILPQAHPERQRNYDMNPGARVQIIK